MQFSVHPELPAVDIRPAMVWHKDKLGLDPVSIGGEPFDPVADHEEMLYDTGTAKFGVYQSPHEGRNLATAARLVTDDFDAAHAELLAHGVVFEDYDLGDDFRTIDGVLVSEDGERTAWFKDSEGNLLAIGSSD